MAKITIWDMDYYYTTEKKNCFNPDAMKISSYHKQIGDVVNFVTKEDDIRRPFDIYYIIKNNTKLPHPPADFFLNNKMRWWGKAYKSRINWKMNDMMLGCRPDYLLYPERNTAIERSEHIRLFNNNAEPLDIVQDWRNTFKNKFLIVTDPYMWFADKKDIIQALKMLQEVKKVSFLEPIWIQKIISYEEIKNEFLKLNFAPGSQINWTNVNFKQVDASIEFIKEFKNVYQHIKPGNIVLDYRDKDKSHWESRAYALTDLYHIEELIIRCKKEGINIQVRMPQHRFETPYFFLFEELAKWTKDFMSWSWLEYITKKWGNAKIAKTMFWTHPEWWNEPFRDLLRQTWRDKEFLTIATKNKSISENDIPWKLWEEEFKYGI